MAPRWKFSVAGLLLFIVIVTVGISSFLNARRLQQTKKELRKLRNETGQLTVEDATLVHVIALQAEQPRTWRWRLFLPKGHRYRWRIAYNDIPRDTVPKHGTSGISNEPYWQTNTEVLVTARLRRSEEMGWRLSVTSKIGEGKEQMGGAALNIPDEDMRWMFEVSSTDGRILGSHGMQVLEPKEPIILLQRRPCEQLPDGSFQPSPNPMPGFMIWLEKI